MSGTLRPAGVAVTIYLPIATVSTTNIRVHWTKRASRAKAQRQQTYLLTAELKRMRPPVTITLTRISPRKLDDDNLQSALKSVRDGIADRLGIDDGDARLRWLYGQEKWRPNQRGVMIQVHAVSGDDAS